MKYYAVIDTNVLVSALLNISSVPGQILREKLVGCITPILHEDIIAEYNDVLHRSKFRFDNHDIEIALTGLINRAVFVDVTPTGDYISDPDDAIFTK